MSESKPLVDRRDDLRTDGFKELNSPGAESNWLDWAFMMETHISASIYAYVMNGQIPSPAPAHYESDKAKVCSILVRYVNATNLSILRRHKGDPRGMWNALKLAHEKNTAGSRIFWLEKLVTFRLESDDICKELDRVESIAERLSSLVTVARPLSVDEILVMVVSTMLPVSFKSTVTPLLQRSTVSSSDVILAVKEEVTRNTLSNRTHDVLFAGSSSRSSSSDPPATQLALASVKGSSPSTSKRGPWCSICRQRGHFASSCERKSKKTSDIDELRAEMRKLKLTVQKSLRPRDESAAVAQSSSVAPPKDASSSESDSEFSYATAIANNSFLDSSHFTIDSGCSIHMVPSASLLANVLPDSTTVFLADGSIVRSSARGVLSPGFLGGKSHSAIVVPALKSSLLSVSRLADEGIDTIFSSNDCVFVHAPASSGKIVGRGYRAGGLYYVKED